MKTLILSIFLLSSYASAKAIDINGNVLDSERNPIEFANVSAFVNDSIVGGCVTDSIGHFSFEVPKIVRPYWICRCGCIPKGWKSWQHYP